MPLFPRNMSWRSGLLDASGFVSELSLPALLFLSDIHELPLSWLFGGGAKTDILISHKTAAKREGPRNDVCLRKTRNKLLEGA